MCFVTALCVVDVGPFEVTKDFVPNHSFTPHPMCQHLLTVIPISIASSKSLVPISSIERSSTLYVGGPLCASLYHPAYFTANASKKMNDVSVDIPATCLRIVRSRMHIMGQYPLQHDNC